MVHPRYASVGALSFSLSRTVAAVAVIAAAALLCGPMLHSPSRLAADRSAAGALSSSTAPAPAVAAPSDSIWLGALPLRPSRIGTAVPAAPVAEVVYGPAGAMGALGIPVLVLKAYHRAADLVDAEQPACKLPWWLLAGIGHTESGHAESGRVTADGTTRGRILGPRLNGGIAEDAVITDTDQGKLDGDTRYDRAVGPMQFIPSTWAKWGADGNGDGKRDPSNIFDATLAAGRYLCAGDRDLSTAAGLKAAVFSYNHSEPYYLTVLAWGTAYRDGVSAVSDSPLPVVGDVTRVRPPISARPVKPRPARVAGAASGAAGSPKPGQPGPTSAAPSCSASAKPTGTAPLTGSATTSPKPTDTGGAAQTKSAEATADASSAGSSTSPARSSSSSASASPTATASCTP